MADEEANLTDDERAELQNPVIEDEDPDTELDTDESLDAPSDLPGDIEDDSGFLEELVDDGDPILEMPDGTPLAVGNLE